MKYYRTLLDTSPVGLLKFETTTENVKFKLVEKNASAELYDLNVLKSIEVAGKIQENVNMNTRTLTAGMSELK